ncbi:cytochrome P450 714C2-like [Olea europaea var. sylvestris]|uniref:cytochrome P450 714C2-like n=1 Tax=Olea europaea var. sylvestris TaxID=158386 RepID=UPI000C1CCDE8|nr:cytochrome P450 714C2-like [Olea europaea var. sylvestris]
MEFHFLTKAFFSGALVGVLGLVFHLYNTLVAKPETLRSALKRQGVSGPRPTLLLGNILEIKKARDSTAKASTNGAPASHNCGATLLPFFDNWRKQYGDVFMFSLGNTQIVHVTQPAMVREITTCTSLDLGKPTYQAKERGSLLGQGILTSNGTIWAHQRKILAPELYMEKVKGMITLVQGSTITLLNCWDNISKKDDPNSSSAIFSNTPIHSILQLTMAINESLRLYPPVAVVSREALTDMKFGDLNIPKGVNLWTIVTTLHTDPDNWGPDSYQFNPERFANGITGACKFPHLYMPFGVGPRVCLGQNLALVELKILISLILSKFSFTLSPKYIHSPALNLVIEPGHGVNLLVQKL